ncbi:MAG: cytochrome c oxidase subunit 3 [Opitutales bacterium]
MSDAAAAAHPGHQEGGHGHSLTDTSTGIENKKMIMWLFLASDCMFFGTLISTHLIYRKIYPDIGVDPTQVFNVALTSFSTFILLMSSFLMALAVSSMHKGHITSFRWSTLGVLFFGLIFLTCQVYEFTEFVHGKEGYFEGFTLSSGTFGSTFFVMTGTHGTHVAIGLVWLAMMLLYSYTGRMVHESALDVEVAGLYWHFVDIVWIVIFTAVYLVEFIDF